MGNTGIKRKAESGALEHREKVNLSPLRHSDFVIFPAAPLQTSPTLKMLTIPVNKTPVSAVKVIKII